MSSVDDYWNHNVHYQQVILDAVPAGCGTALDVGCGDGMLACKLASRCQTVTGIDRDARMIELARERAEGRATGSPFTNVTFINDDFLKYPFNGGDGDGDDRDGGSGRSGSDRDGGSGRSGSDRASDSGFDFVCANTVVHHMGTAAALERMARILRPGGRLVVLGLGETGSRADYLPDLIAIPLNRYYQRTRGESDPGAPRLGPDLTWAQVRETARRILPGARYRRHLLWRYSLTWDKPPQLP